jgi:hypothetical protein
MTWILKSWPLKTWTPSTRYEIALILAILMLAGTATYLAIKLARPQPLADTVLGDRWQCSRTAYIVTICTKRPSEAIARGTDASVGYVAAR